MDGIDLNREFGLLSKSDRFPLGLAYCITAPFGVEPHQAVDQAVCEGGNFCALRQIRQKLGIVIGDP